MEDTFIWSLRLNINMRHIINWPISIQSLFVTDKLFSCCHGIPIMHDLSKYQKLKFKQTRHYWNTCTHSNEKHKRYFTIPGYTVICDFWEHVLLNYSRMLPKNNYLWKIYFHKLNEEKRHTNFITARKICQKWTPPTPKLQIHIIYTQWT